MPACWIKSLEAIATRRARLPPHLSGASLYNGPGAEPLGELGETSGLMIPCSEVQVPHALSALLRLHCLMGRSESMHAQADAASM